MPHVFTVNCTGPDGRQYPTGALVPENWDANYVVSLVKTGGAKKATKTDVQKAGDK